MRKEVVEAMNRTEPIQSTRRSWKARFAGAKLDLRNKGTKIKATPMMGRLM